MKDSFERAKEKCTALGLKPTSRVIVVSIARQLLGLYQDGALLKSYVVSTSLRPPSNIKDSLGTPRGLHEIAEKHGAGAPPGIVFKGRVSTGQHFSEFAVETHPRSYVTTRILWLRGLERGINAGQNSAGEVVDSFARYIYIHGTNLEHKLGSPASSGCVQLSNLEMIDLFEQVRTQDLVWIED